MAKDRRSWPRGRKRGLPAWVWLVIGIAGCAHLDWIPVYERQLPEPTDPRYPTVVLKAREEHLREIQRWHHSLDALRRLIELRQAGRIARDQGGKIVAVSEDLDLQRWRLEMENELLRARSALYRLERKVKADFKGELPAWWPHDNG